MKRTMNTWPAPPIDEEWSDGRRPDSFFDRVYYAGDDSNEGHLNRVPLSQIARTIRECDMVMEQFAEQAPHHRPAEFKVLDCPCGEGRHSIELARRGYTVVGADLSPGAIARARQALARETEPVRRRCTFVEADMRSLGKLGGKFCAVINLFFSFGFFCTDGDKAALRSFWSALVPGGLLLIHTDVNRYLIDARKYGNRAVRTLRQGGKLVINERWNRLNGRLEGTWTVTLADGSVKSAPYSVHIYTSAEMEQLLAACGFDYLGEKAVPVFGERLSVKESQELLYLGMKP